MQSIIEILTEPVCCHEHGEILIGRGDDAHIERYGPLAAKGIDLTAFDGSQDFCLSVEAHFAHFIEEERASGGGPEFSLVRPLGTGESAPFESEQFAFEQGVGKCRNSRA